MLKWCNDASGAVLDGLGTFCGLNCCHISEGSPLTNRAVQVTNVQKVWLLSIAVKLTQHLCSWCYKWEKPARIIRSIEAW